MEAGRECALDLSLLVLYYVCWLGITDHKGDDTKTCVPGYKQAQYHLAIPPPSLLSSGLRDSTVPLDLSANPLDVVLAKRLAPD